MKVYYKYALWRHAREGTLDTIEIDRFTENEMLIKSRLGDTLFHEAADYGNLHQLPRHLLSAKNVAIKNKNGDTPMHHVCYRRTEIDKLPQSIFTAETLFVKNNIGFSAYLISTFRGEENLFFGIDFPETCRKRFGEVWWTRNQAILRAKKEVGILDNTKNYDIELF